jgi:biotin carboxyl carrier protein
MTATQSLENLQDYFQLSANKIKRGLNGLRPVRHGRGARHAVCSRIHSTLARECCSDEFSSRSTANSNCDLVTKPNEAANLVLPGSTQAIQETALYARTNGYVRKWNVDIGAKVEAGQLLAEIETPELDQELNQARANVAQAIANADLARATLTRWQQLVDRQNSGECNLSGGPIILESQPPDTLRPAIVQERAHFCSRSDKQKKFAIWAIYLGKLSEI